MDTVIAENLNIEFPIYGTKGRSLRHLLFLNPLRSIPKHFVGSKSVGGTVKERNDGVLAVNALHNINLRLKNGDRLGLIGHNGSGKTTLLRALAGIYEPTSGSLVTHGKIMPLFNITEGMAPDATGRELIQVRCVLLGIEQADITRATPDIIEFCQLGDYLDMPIRTYSQGMLVRLAFAITTAFRADILLFDELIGAGDASFVEQAHKRLSDFVERSNVLVVASHSTEIIRKWCNRAILLEHGKLLMDADVESVLDAYAARVPTYAG